MTSRIVALAVGCLFLAPALPAGAFAPGTSQWGPEPACAPAKEPGWTTGAHGPTVLNPPASNSGSSPTISLSNTTWNASGSPYVVNANLTIAPGATLRILPGVEVRLAPAAAIYVHGTLNVSGTALAPVHFNGTTARSPWQGIASIDGGRILVAGAFVDCAVTAFSLAAGNNWVSPWTELLPPSSFVVDSVIQNATTGLTLASGGGGYPVLAARDTFLGNDCGASGNVRIRASTFEQNYYGTCNFWGSIWNSTFAYNNNTGAELQGGNITLSTITHNGIGVRVSGGTAAYDTITNNTVGVEVDWSGQYAPPIYHNNLAGNTLYALKMSTSYGRNAPLNWWGSTSTQAIEASIYDSHVNGQQGTAYVTPALSAPPSTTFPSAPTKLAAREGPLFVNLTWAPPASNGGSAVKWYSVYRAVAGAPLQWIAAPSFPGIADFNITPGRQYTYYVAAVSDAAESAPATIGTMGVGPAGAPDATATTGPGPHNITVTWKAPSRTGGEPITGYVLYRNVSDWAIRPATGCFWYPGMSGGCHSLPADGPQTNQSIVATLGNVSQYNDTGLASGVRYFYTVRAVTALGRGFFANLTNATTSSPAGTPLNFQASPGPDHNEITLTWTMPEGGSNAAPITGFNLYRQTNPYFPPPENNFCPSPTATGCMPGGSNPAPNEPIYAHLNASAGTFVDKGVGAQMYWYILASVSSAGQSFPAWTQGQTYVQPPMPFLTAQAGPNAGEITVHWLPNIGNPKAVTAFHLDRNNGSGWEPVGNFTWNGSPNGTSYVDEGFANGEAVSYRMYAANPAGVSGYSSTPEVVAGNMPDAVAGLSVGPGSVPGSIDISWTRVRDSTFAPTLAYRLYRSAGSGAASVLASTLNGTFEDSGLDGNTTYLYTVTTVNRFGEGPAAPLISGKPASVPQAPQVAAAAGPASGNLTIKWTLDPHPIAALFRIYVQNGTNLTFVGTAKGTDRAFVVGGLGRGTTRTFVVTGVNSAGEGAESSPASAKTFDVPAAPSQLTANGALNAGEIDLAWRAPQEDGGAAITAYRIYRAANASAPMHLLATVAASPQLYRDVGLANDTSFLYEISAVNPVGESALSAPVTATTEAKHASSVVPGLEVPLVIGLLGGMALLAKRRRTR